MLPAPIPGGFAKLGGVEEGREVGVTHCVLVPGGAEEDPFCLKGGEFFNALQCDQVGLDPPPDRSNT